MKWKLIAHQAEQVVAMMNVRIGRTKNAVLQDILMAIRAEDVKMKAR